ncbi:MAG: peptidylprolyl isomerase [Eubacteriales bacterium]
MKHIKKIASVILCIALLASLTACSMVSVDKDKEANQVVATVGKTNILKKDFDAQYKNYTASAGYTDAYLKDAANKQTVTDLKKYILDTMVGDEAAYQWAIANGLDLTDAEKQKVKDDLASTINSYKQSIEEQVKAEASSEPNINVEQEIASQEKTQLADVETPEYLQGSIRYQVLQKFSDSINKTVAVTDDQVKQRYDLEVQNQKLMLENIATYQMNVSMGNAVYVYPTGTKAIQQVLIAIPPELQTQIQTLRQNNSTQQADNLLQQELAKIKSKADEALAAVKAGGDFDSLIDKYGEDPGMTSDPGKTKGYYVYPGDTSYVQSFVNASIALQNVGDTSGLVASDYGYHILKLIKIPDQVTPFDDIKDTLKASLLTEAQNSALSQKRQEIIKAAQVSENYGIL